MATRRRVKCINKTNRTEPHNRIENIGGDGWLCSEEDAIAYIENGTYEYYTHEDNEEAKVIIAKREGKKYLKTENDGEQPDNLLALPECGSSGTK